MLVAALAAFGLIAGACGDKKDDTAAPSGTDAPAADTTVATGGTEGAGGTETTTEAPTEETTTTAPEVAPTIGGKLIVAGEAEVANPWTPLQMQCDSYCQMRARAFFDPLVVVDQDLEPQPFLAESVTPNADFTEWTVTLREGITFHDGGSSMPTPRSRT
jgi:peptide/nickel transport system substrate-binding protein